MLREVELDGFVLEKKLRLAKTSTMNEEHTLDLTMHIGGTDVYPAAWSVDATSVPFWLSLPGQGSIGATEKSGNLSLTASTAGLVERLATPYEALLNLSVISQRDRMVLVLVQLYVSAPSGTSMDSSSLAASVRHARSLVCRPQMLVLATVGALT